MTVASICLVNMETGDVMTVTPEAVAELGVRPPWKDAATFTDDEWLQSMTLVAERDRVEEKR